MNFRPNHIPFSRLVDWVEKRLTAEEDAQLQHHIDNCSHCQQEVAQLERLIGIMRSDTAIDPPPAVIARALRIFQPRHTPATPSLLQRVVAALQFDSAQFSPALSLRAVATPRQLLYSAGAYDLDLRLMPHQGAWLLSGQVLGDDITTGQVVLQGATNTVQAPLAPPGEFVLPLIPAGDYTLVVKLSDYEIAVDTLQVGT